MSASPCTEQAVYAPRPAPALPEDAHKGDAGRLLCMCGSLDMPGAAVLTVRAALRAGSGLVTLACFDPGLREMIAAHVPECIYLDLTKSRDLMAGRLPGELRGRLDHARVAGCGLGVSGRTDELVRRLVDDAFEGPLVLDADALNVIGETPEVLNTHAGPLVLTPHPGEASRLLGRAVPADDAGRVEAAREIARRAGAVCCLKGHRTVIADGTDASRSDERIHVNTTGNAGMASAGTGDVLAGIVAAYLATCVTQAVDDWSVFDAVAAAVHVHGLAGDLAAGALGQRAVIASDLIEALPAAQQAFERASG